VLRIVIDVLIGIGLVFALAGTKGIIKMPDTFSRMQASTCVNTMGVIGVALGAQRSTLMGLAGMGDLILTCTGDLSRNRRVGLGLGKGQTLDEILTQLGHVAEGVPCSHAAVLLARRHNVELPICETVAELLTSPRPDPRAAVERLLAREPREEE
ncbi:MAG: monovalent cation/H(+) antiporter subunit G, partial [Rhodocyclaceae bacterium]|nr:monovalent cation/H(+) antiporter subunit G [Rhodocyclaceae bacterium]